MTFKVEQHVVKQEDFKEVVRKIVVRVLELEKNNLHYEKPHLNDEVVRIIKEEVVL